MKDQKETLIDWLRDAHAMESNIVNMLEKQAKHLDNYPAMRQRVAEHAEESKRHAERVEQCLKNLGSDTSSLKEGLAKLSGKASPAMMSPAPDEPVKCALANIGTEHFEMACYESLRAAAERCGEAGVADVADSILREEEAMAGFLEDQLSNVTKIYLDQRAAETAAR